MNHVKAGRFAVMMIAGASFCLPAMAQDMRAARGVIKANAKATISVGLTAKVALLPFRAGQSFHKGDVIIAFSCARYRADFRARAASYKAAAEEAKNNKRLLRHQAIGASAVAVSAAKMEEAKAVMEGQQALVSQCEVKAPYEGRVVELLINEHETPGANQPLIKIVDASKAELELIVPSKWLVWLRPEVSFKFVVDETGARISAKVKRLGAVVDAVSQTIKITAEFGPENKTVLPGMSGTATFSFPES